MQHDLKAVPSGIARLIKDNKLRVPPYQREYSWSTDQISQLLEDIYTAYEKNEDYFLGSIMLIADESAQNSFSIVDGQQRLATISILISAMRNYLKENDPATNKRVQKLEDDFLFSTDLHDLERDLNLSLSERDVELFEKILTDPEGIDLSSSEKLVQSLRICTDFLEQVLGSVTNDVSKLVKILDFILDRAQVITVTANNEASAYVIFETLNDRGLSLSLADLVKNYLFGLSKDKLDLAKSKWISLLGAFTSADAEDDLKNYIRYFWMAKYGYVSDKQVFNQLKSTINSKGQAIDLISDLEQSASSYLALNNASHPLWKALGHSSSKNIENINQIKFIQYKPLMLAVLNSSMSDSQKRKMLSFTENWAVRLVYGSGTRSGTIAEKFSQAAVKVSNGELSSASEIAHELDGIIPDDESFKEQFSKCNVSTGYTARYLLSKLENQLRSTETGTEGLEISRDTTKVNLEHILPKKTDLSLWSFDEDQHSQQLNRLGNQSLMLVPANSTGGSEEYSTKKKLYESSEILITKQIPSNFDEWNSENISARQKYLAEIAVETWPKT